MTRAEVDASDALFDAFAAWALAHGVSVHGGTRRVDWVRAELPEVFGEPTPKTVLELYGPWDFGTPSGRVAVELTRPRTVDRIAWASRGTDLSLCDGEPSTQRKTARRPGRPLAHLGADATPGLE